MVVGIVLALISGTLIIGFEPVENIYELLLCAVFGSGAALILDEFALVFRLQDVYFWSDEGRASIDAVIVAITVGVLVLLHIVPFDDKTSQDGGRWTLLAIFSIHIAPVVVTMLKGKIWLGLIGILVAFVSLVGAIRPPPRRPGRGTSTSQRAATEGRGAPAGARQALGREDEKLLDVIGGAPSAPETD